MNILGKNTLGMLGIAAFTMVASIALLTPHAADAAEEEAKTAENLRTIKPYISVPSLEEDGCTITLKTDKESYAAGEKPVLTLEITNNSDKAVTKTIELNMTGREVESRSRMPARAEVLWELSKEVTLAAGEKKTLTLETNVALAENQAVAFNFGKDEMLERPIRIKDEGKARGTRVEK